MKSSIKILVFFLTITSFAQNNLGGTVTYKKILNVELINDKNIPVDILHKYQNMKKSMGILTYQLTFYDNKSVFKMNDIMEVDNQKLTQRVIGKGLGNGIHFVDLKNKSYIHNKELFGKFYNVYNNKKLLFKITNQTKKIGAYTCYKAEATDIIEYFGTSNTVNYIAWFTPQIPFNFGPALFYGLPGLVLEADINNTKYLAVEINLSIKNLKVDKPTNGKKISQEEFDNIIKKSLPDKS